MPLQGAPSDINIITPFCRDLYRRCRETGNEYEDVGRDTFALHGVLKQLRNEYGDVKSPLHTDLSLLARKLVPLVNESNTTLLLLEGLLDGRARRGSNGAQSSSPKRPVVERQSTFLTLAPDDQLVAIRAKILSHKTSLSLLLDNIKLHASRTHVDLSEEHSAELDSILDEVDRIASRLSRKASAQGSAERSLWKRIRDELLEKGFDYEVLQQHKDCLKAYIHEMDHDAHPKSSPDKSAEAFPTFKPDQIDIPKTYVSSGDPSPKEPLPPVDTYDLARPTKPRAQTEFTIPRLMKEHMNVVRNDARYPTPLTIPTSPQPKTDYYTLITPEMFAEDLLYSAEHSGSENADVQKVREGQPIPSKIIETHDLNHDLSLSPKVTDAASYFGNAEATSKSDGIAGLGISVPLADSITLPSGASAPDPEIVLPGDRRQDASTKAAKKKKLRLAPDSAGKPIAADAKWTKIKRSLVSPEVLRQDGRRFEANPDFVAVLGQLTREEIQEYAARSLALREARWSRPRPQIPRAFTYQVPRPTSSGSMSTSPQPQSATASNTHWTAGQPTPSPDGKSDSEDEPDKERDESVKNIRGILSRQHQTFSAGSSSAAAPRAMRRTSYQSQTGWPNAHGSPMTKRLAGDRSSSGSGGSTSVNTNNNGGGVSAPASAGLLPKSPSLSPTPNGASTLQPAPPGLDRASTMMNLSTATSTARARETGSPRPGVTFAEEVTISTTEDLDKAHEAARKKDGNGNDVSPTQNAAGRGLKRWKTTYKEQGIGGTAIKLVNVLTDAAGI